jgi:hypothetical protein
MLGGPSFCVGAPGSCGGGAFLTVYDADEAIVALGAGCAQMTCDTCQERGCPTVCPISTPLAEAAIEQSWSGERWVEDTCGAEFACTKPTCAAVPGNYVARFCAFPLEGAAGAGGAAGDEFFICDQYGSPTPTCVEVEFSYPTSEPVVGVLALKP